MEAARVIDITEVDKKDAELGKKALQVVDIKSTVVVIDNDSMSLADDLKKKCRKVIKMIDDEYQPIAKSAFDHHRAITAKWNAKKKPYEDFEAELTKQVKLYLAECRRKEEEEAARLREEARRQAEEEQLARALDAEQSGNADEANEILETAPVYVAPVPVVDRPKVDGRLYKTTIKVKVVNRMAFLSNVKPETLLECLTENAWQGIEAGLARKARALGKAFKLSGCQVQEI
jgi:hypothetical protein